MDTLTHFVPGKLAPLPASGIGAYLPAMPEGVASAYVAALTQPGDLVLDPFCQTGRVLREALALGRRALGANLNPVATHWIEAQIWPENARLALAALVRLGDQPRGDTLLRQHVLDLYATRCPTCKKNAVAESFVWNRDEGNPIEKTVRCAACGTVSAGPTDEADVLAARRFEPHGMAYHLMLKRATPNVPDASEEHERAASVIEAYTPRTLSALADILRKYDGVSEADQSALDPHLLSAFEAALALHSAEQDRPRPRSLKIPPRFVERNVWLALQDLLQPPLSGKQSEVDKGHSLLIHAPDVDALMARRDPAACVIARSARELSKLTPSGSVSLILAVPPQADPTFWALSAVWAGWLWGHTPRSAAERQMAESVRRLLARRRADMDWLWRGLAQALGALVPMLAESGRIVLVSPDADEDLLGGLLLAGAGNGLALDHALVEPQQGLRVMWHTAPSAPIRALDADALGIEMGERARRAASEFIRERGEPTPWPFVHAAIQSELARAGLLQIAARMPEGGPLPLDLINQAIFDGLRALRAGRSPVYPVEDVRGAWWLADPSKAEPPLVDRIEATVVELLAQCAEWVESDLIAEVYRRFSAALTPEYATVHLCLESYAVQIRAGIWAVREEDSPAQRQAEVASLRGELSELGQRLGCEATEHEGRVTWTESAHGTRRPLFGFILSATAELGTHLLIKRPPRGQPVLVLPGGRGALAHYKLRHDVRLREAVMGAGWTFLKFRQLRSLVAQTGLDISTFRDALGLDPLIEKEGQQMTLL
jgi:hypothetical protein